MQQLPIDSYLQKIVETLNENPCLVLEASPGSGKTTRVPPALLKLQNGNPKSKILVLEPRRLAAKYAAIRVAEELGTEVGDLVGYHFRFEKNTSPHTRILFLTEGMLMRYLMQDPTLRDVSTVILDEFHERHLQTDLALGLVQNLQSTSRPDLKILVMSATLDTESVTKFLGGAPSIQIKAVNHTVGMHYLSEPSKKYLDALVLDAVRNEVEARPSGGHLLVFLPGMSEIRRAESALLPLSKKYDLLILALHGELDRGAQDLALKPSKKRKVILSTNVAESSLTIDGVDCVIDSGLERTMSYSAWTGIPSLVTRKISKASAIQRSGRAGRTGPGNCRRLYTQHEFATWQPFQVAEVHRADLAQTALDLLSMGWKDVAHFPWFEKPPAASLQTAIILLQKLGAIQFDAITPMGKQMCKFPVHPRIARMLLESEKQGCVESAARLAALIVEGQLETLDAMDDLHGNPSFQVKRTEDRLKALCEARTKNSAGNLAFCVLSGFPDRVAQRRTTSAKTNAREVEILFCTGGHACIEENAFSLGHSFFIVLDLQENKKLSSHTSKIYVHSACAITEVELMDLVPSQIEESNALYWDKPRERVNASYQLKFGLLTLDEKPGVPTDKHAAFQLFINEGLRIKAENLKNAEIWASTLERFCDRDVLNSEFARVKLYLEHTRKGEGLNCELLEKALQDYLDGDFSITKMKTVDWSEFIPFAFLGSEAGQMNRLMPQHLRLTPSRNTRIFYAMNQNPWIESRLQDFFGMKVGPSILNGKLPLTLHLLAPNHRAVQVTSDLAGFWERSYPKVRQELGRKYPRHKWPENPLKVENQKL